MMRNTGVKVTESTSEGSLPSLHRTQECRGKSLTQLQRPPQGRYRGKQYNDIEDIGKSSPLFRHAVPLCCKYR